MDKDLDRILEKQPELISNLPNLRTLCLAPSSVNELAACQKVVENAPHLTNLCIDSCFYDIADDLVTELDDNSARPGLITSTIFGHMAPFKDCKPLALRSLVLNSVNLRYASDTYMEIIEFRSLERLAIENCGGADAIIAEITKSAHRPSNLRSFGLFHEEDSQNYTIAALENFLLSFSGIQTINISLSESRRLPTISCFTKHGNTLKELVIHAKGTENDNKPLQYPTDDFNTICRECIKVRQLAVTFPPFNINSPNFSPEFDKYLLSAWHLRDLVTLNITNWPEQNQTNESYVEYQFNNYAVHPARNSRNHRRSRRGRGNPRGPIAPPPGPPPPPMGRGGRGVVNPPGLMMIPPPPPPGIAHYNGVSMSRTMYEHVCQLIAQRIFDANREHAKSKQRDARLRVVAFGFRSEEDFCRSISGGKRRQISFLPSKLTDPFGQTLDSVTRLKRDMVQFVEPESMVLTPSPFILDSAG
ncbi:MAG: hypothetical protein M1829_006581 [Trizodia sp. TS-e1964]|nr:MAG: hypothetical protein M1829_006581 [Trizodia sp. TS-e1964]